MSLNFIKDIFVKKAYETEELLYLLSQVMASSLTFKVLTQNILEIIRQKLRIAKAGVIVIDSRGRLLKEVAPDWQTPYEIAPEDLTKLGETNDKDLLKKYKISLFLPLKTNHRLVGYLIFSGKSTKTEYTPQDIKTLEIFSPEFAVAIENSLAYEEIRQFNDTLQTEVKNATDELRQANQRLLELDRLKDEFISIASHDLRTPVSAVKNFLWLTINKESQLAPKVRDNLERAYNAADRTALLISDMLDVSRIEGRRLEVRKISIDLAKAFNEVREDIDVKAKAKKINLLLDCPASTTVLTDPNKLLQIINNLVDNAIKFTPIGGKIEVKARPVGNKVVVSVSDTGMGIEKSDLPKLFTKFGRLHSSLSSVPEIPGTGLGLYITKKLLDLLGETIEVTSEVNKGTTFTFTLEKA